MENLFRNFASKKSTKWTYYFFIILITLGVSLWFLWGTPRELPMGDSYIHFLYARNLAFDGILAYNHGSTEGIGTSSLLWVLILAFFQLMGFSPLIISQLLGIVLLILSGIIVFELVLKFIDGRSEPANFFMAAVIAIFGLLSGSMVWLALSGMETILFLALGLLCLWLYTRESWVLLGISLGLLALTRIEGISLACILVLVEVIRSKRISQSVVKIIIPLFLILTPWLVYLQIREGVPVSSSFQGRQYVVSAVEDRIANQFPLFSLVQKINPLIHTACWVYFAFFLLTGSFFLPGPDFSLGGNLAGTELTLPLAGIVISCLCLPLIVIAIKKIGTFKKWPSLHQPNERLKVVVFGWLFLFNLAYALFLPHIGAAGRYIPMNHMAFWFCLLLGSTLVKSPILKRLPLVFVVMLFGLGLNYWRSVYRANVDYMANVRKKAAVFIDSNYPPGTPIGATDLGAIGYYAQQPVVDLFGHINQDFNKFIENGGNTSDYIAKEHLCYLMLFDSVDNVGLDLQEEMGLSDDPRFYLSLEKSFSVPVEEWDLGNGPIRNYMPAVNIYRIHWQNQTSCAPQSSTRNFRMAAYEYN